jgi:adenylate cyclase
MIIREGEEFRPVAANGEPAFVDAFWHLGPVRPPEGSPPERLLRGERIVHVADFQAEDFLQNAPPQLRRATEIGGIRTMVAVPLRKDDAVIGIITAFRKEIRPFSDKQIVLLENFAAQAVIAIENARLITETREALEQQTATADVLQVINSSPGDLKPVFEAILEKAHALCGADLGSFAINNGERMPSVATRGYPEEHARVAGEGLPTNGENGQRLARGEIVHQLDLRQRADGPDRTANAIRHAAVELTGSRTYLAVPLRKDGVLLGYLSAHRQEVRPFTDKQIALLQNFAAQAVIAIENARLITETREALEQQTATAEMLQVINSSPGDLAPVFDAMLEKATTLCDAAFGIMLTWDGQCFHRVAFRGASAELIAALREPNRSVPGSMASQIVDGAGMICAADIRDEPAYRVPPIRSLVDIGGARSYVAVALRRNDTLLGVFSIYRQEVRPFSDKEIALLQNFAAQAVVAMENARLLGELRGRTQDLQESLEYQTATSDVLQVMSRSTFDLQPVLDTVAETAARLCAADSAGIAIREGEVYRYVSMSTSAAYPEYWANTRERTIVPGRDSVVARVALEGRVVHVPDIRTIPDYAFPETVALGTRTVLGVPLLRDSEPIGIISLTRKRLEPFTERQIELVRTFADQAVIAMENARLLGELHQRTDEVAELNRGLEVRVAEQVEELGRVGRLKRFLAPQLAELIVSQGDEKILESHRREIVVVFCDLRGYTAFTETAEPEEVLDFLSEYHGALGPLVSQFEGTLDQFSGDGIMVFFNDPVPCSDPAERAVRMTLAMREAAAKLIAAWRRRGRELGFGAGIAQGYATLGQIGFAERSGYTAIGTVCNVAARLCAEAKDGQILLSQRVAVAVEGTTTLEEVGALTLKGLTQPVVAYNVSLATSQPALRVIEGSPQSV